MTDNPFANPEYQRRRAAIVHESSEAGQRISRQLTEDMAKLRAEFGITLPTIYELTGSDPDFTGDLDSAAYLRHLRGGTLAALMALRAALAPMVEVLPTPGYDLGDHEGALIEACETLASYVGDPEVTRLVKALTEWRG